MSDLCAPASFFGWAILGLGEVLDIWACASSCCWSQELVRRRLVSLNVFALMARSSVCRHHEVQWGSRGGEFEGVREDGLWC